MMLDELENRCSQKGDNYVLFDKTLIRLQTVLYLVFRKPWCQNASEFGFNGFV